MSADSIAELLRRQAAIRPDAVAVHYPTSPDTPAWRALTFGELDQLADDLARGFAAEGVQPGDRVLLLVRPSADFYGIVFGLVRAGGVPVFIDPGMGPKNALGCVRTIAPRVVIGPPVVHVVRQVIRAPFRSLELAITTGWPTFGLPSLDSLARPGEGPFADRATDGQDDAVIVFTSGSTGSPKAVGLPHDVMKARVERIRDLFELEAGATIVETLLVYTILEVCMGMTVVVPPMDVAKPATVDPARLVDTIQRFTPSIASASPIVWHRLVRHAIAEGTRLDSLQMLLTTAAPIPIDLHKKLSQVVPSGTELFTPYGATEAMPIARIGTAQVLATTAAETARGAGTCVGELAPGAEVRIVPVTDGPIPEMTDDLPLGAGEMGEIVVRGDGVSPGYRNNDEADRLGKIHDPTGRWHRMGDLGYLDDDGKLWFCGRTSHRLQTRRGMVSAVCIEGILNTHPQVFRSAVVGIGPAGAQEPIALVELEDDAVWSEQIGGALLAMLQDSAYADTISAVYPHPGFPTDTRHNSKIRREDLRGWAAQRARR